MLKSSSPLSSNPIVCQLKNDKDQQQKEKIKLQDNCYKLSKECDEFEKKIQHQKQINERRGNIIDLRNVENLENELKEYKNAFEIEKEEKKEQQIIPIREIKYKVEQCTYDELIKNFQVLAPKLYLSKSNEKNFTEFKVTLEVNAEKPTNQAEFLQSIEGRNPTIFIAFKKSLIGLINLPELPKKIENNKKNKDDKTYVNEKFRVEMYMYNGEIVNEESYIKIKNKKYNGFDLYESSKVFCVTQLFEIMNGNRIQFFNECLFGKDNEDESEEDEESDNEEEIYEKKNFESFYENQEEEEGNSWAFIDYMIVGNWVPPSTWK